MTVKKANSSGIRQAAQIIRKGGVAAFPTETVYGLGANAFNAQAVAKIFEIKNRPFFDPLIVHIDHKKMLRQLCSGIPPKAKKLMEKFWPGPLTLVLPKNPAVPDIVTAGLGSVAVRMPDQRVALKLIRESKCPIAAPSANPFGYLSPTTAEHVKKQLGNKTDFILDGGRCRIGVESTIVDFSGKAPVILRYGGLDAEQITKIIGPVSSAVHSKKIKSPGQLPSHYSPRTRIFLVKNLASIKSQTNQTIGGLAFKEKPRDRSRFKKIEVLSPSGDLRDAASKLFAALHRLDQAQLDVIYAEVVPNKGLGRAIMDRLTRAQHTKS